MKNNAILKNNATILHLLNENVLAKNQDHNDYVLHHSSTENTIPNHVISFLFICFHVMCLVVIKLTIIIVFHEAFEITIRTSYEMRDSKIKPNSIFQFNTA